MGSGVQAKDLDAVLWAVESQQGFGGGVRQVNLVLEGTHGCWPHMSPARY